MNRRAFLLGTSALAVVPTVKPPAAAWDKVVTVESPGCLKLPSQLPAGWSYVITNLGKHPITVEATDIIIPPGESRVFG